jgi:hypothetical protein
MTASMFRHYSLSLALTLILLGPAQAGETKTMILLEIAGGTPIECLRSPDEKSMQQCMALSEHKSRTLRGEVFVEMRLDPNCAGMGLARDFSDLEKTFGPLQENDFIKAWVIDLPATKEKEWWLTILIINGKPGPDSMNGKAANAKEIAHKLCYIIYQEKITRR